MKFWWVNHKQTAKQEIGGGYIWSPKRKKNGQFNVFYENMRAARPGDQIVSFANAQIGHHGVVSDYPISSAKPDDFGAVGTGWENDGWLVPIAWEPLEHPLRPKVYISEIASLLPKQYSPIRRTGDGNQGAYLAEISNELMKKLAELGSFKIELVAEAPSPSQDYIDEAENRIQRSIEADTLLDQTEVDAVVKARKGQGKFRRNVEALEPHCRVTGVTDKRLLVASHIKPWRVCETGTERLDGNNGLLLAPHVDLLFDKGLMTFENDGLVRVSASLSVVTIKALGLPDALEHGVGAFSDEQVDYLQYHRESVFLG